MTDAVDDRSGTAGTAPALVRRAFKKAAY
jgi:hypothetical protein